MSGTSAAGVDDALFSGWSAPRLGEDDPSDLLTETNLAPHDQVCRVGYLPSGSCMGDHPLGKPFVLEFGDSRSLHFDWACVQSGMSIANPLKLSLEYTKTMMGFLFFNPDPRHIEMIGLGGGSLAKYCHHALPDADITVVEIRSDVIDLREHFLIPSDSDRFRILCGDGADYVKASPARPDILMVDGFDDVGQPPQLCSSEFYDHCYSRLGPEGLMVVNLWGKDRDYRHHAARIEQSFFGNLIIVPSEGTSNKTVFARKGSRISLSTAELERSETVFKDRDARFLPAIGKRIVRQFQRRTKQNR
ncbi:MAG: fused MFS/spermidine synthase [Sphingomonas sp.]|uniref:fused MFS/spermidine synthase n=1 Tax=Sphingomonas sp. TaxID=28214 RepID=UPI003569EC84